MMQHRHKVGWGTAFLVLVVFAVTLTAVLAKSGASGPITVYATGDLGGSVSEIKPVADLIKAGMTGADDRALLLGDICYPDGAPDCYPKYVDPNYGSIKSRVIAAPGNHDYHTANGAGYFGYYPDLLPKRFDLANNWTVITINTEVPHGAGSAMELGVKALANAASAEGRHIIAITHHPRYTGGGSHGDDTSLDAIVGDLDAARADLFLAAHNHIYERFQPMGPGNSLRSEGAGVRFFTVGTGGNGLYSCTSHVGRQACIDTNHGALKLSLDDGGYSWSFQTTSGQSLDGGSASTRIPGGSTPTTTTTTTTTSSTTTTSTSLPTTTTTTGPPVTTTTTLPISGTTCEGRTIWKSVTGRQTVAYRPGTIPAGKAIEAKGASWVGTIPFPATWAGSPDSCFFGGVAWGTWDYATTPWETFHHAGAFNLKPGPASIMKNLVAVNYGDSFRIEGASPGFILERSIGVLGHDDCIENDWNNGGTIKHNWCESYVSYSARASATQGGDGSANTVKFSANYFKLAPTPTVYKGPDTIYKKYPANGTGPWFKLNALSPAMELWNNVFEASKLPNHGSLALPGKVTKCQGNVIIWTGAGAFPEKASWLARCPDTTFIDKPEIPVLP